MVKLRPFQQQLEYDVYQAWQTQRNVLAVSATGSGKTVLFSKILSDNPGASVAIAHRQELVSQISVALARNGVRHRIIGPAAVARNIVALHMAAIKRSYYDPNAKCASAGVDTLIRMDANDPWFHQVSLWVQDEAHHVLQNNKWGKAASMFPNARGLGVTATPERADGCGLGRHADGLFDAMVLAPSMRDLINMGYLTDYRIFAPPSDLDLTQVTTSTATGDFNADQVRKAVHKSHITGDVVAHYQRIAPGKLGVTFAVDVESATDIAKAFRAAGVPAEVVSAKTPDTLRAAILRRFANRELLQLVNVDLFGEGFDLPALEVVSMARPTQSFSLYAQQFGRSLRLMIDDNILAHWDSYTDDQRRAFIAASTKPNAIIIDHVSNVLRHLGPPDRLREWSLDRRERRSKSQALDVIPYRVCLNPVCVAPYERFYKCCPFCGHYPTPPDRSAPAFVDGDLMELSPEALSVLRGEIAKIDDAHFQVPRGATPEIAGALKRRHWEKQQTQAALRNAIAWWSGLQNAQGRDDLQEQYRRFFFAFGVDVAGAQALGVREADALRIRINRELELFGVDGTVNMT